MRAISTYANAVIVMAAMLAPGIGAYAKTTSFRFQMSPSRRWLARSNRPTCATPGKHMREILISVDIASRRINFPRCRARRLVSHSARAANVCKDIG